MEAALYLIPVNISDAPLDSVLPGRNLHIVSEIRHYIVENVRTARRFLKRCNREIDIDSITFHELNVHTDPLEVSSFLEPLRRGEPVGVMSEAGCPGVADPGSVAVALAQKEGLKVVPLVGPSSILMSLMASGFNGQSFTFHGYLPIEKGQRAARLKELERHAYHDHTTQIFIETPYRNGQMLDTLCSVLRPETLLCVASGITDINAERIITFPIAKWRTLQDKLDKKTPSIFLIYHP